jgi:plastocyanin
VRTWRLALYLVTMWLWGSCAWSPSPAADQQSTVTMHVKIQAGPSSKMDKPAAAPNGSEIVVWLTPLDASAAKADTGALPAKRPQVVQRNKSFHPHVTVVRVGSVVDFPNRDPFFHNVFSLFDGKRFDLGLYEAGATNSVRFDHVGISYLFCNIHPEMSAVVVAVDTPYYGISDKSGNLSIGDVPEGRYELHVWYERSLPESLKGLSREVHITADSHDLGTIQVQQDPSFTPTHKNKYGQDYAPPPKQGYSTP